MLTIKQYAESRHISYEAARKSFNRYYEDIKGHVTKQGRMNLVDDEGAAFLDGKRQENPVVVVNEDKNERIASLEAENKALLLKVTQLQDELLKERNTVKELMQDKIQLLEEKKKAEEKTVEEALEDIAKRPDVVTREDVRNGSEPMPPKTGWRFFQFFKKK